MAEDNQIRLEIVLDDGSVVQGFAKIENEGKKTASSLGKMFSINGFADLYGAVNLVSSGFSKLQTIVSAGINNSIEAERASAKLAAALRSVPGATADAASSFERFSEELSKKIGVDNDVINSNAALIASIGRLSGDALEKATLAAANLSAGLGVSLEDASRRLALAAEGNVTAFQKLGFEFNKNASDSEKLKSVIDQVNQRFGNLANNLANNTFEGVMNRIKVAIDNASEALGDFVTKSPVIREVLKIFAESVERITEFLKSANGKDFLETAILQMVKFSQYVTDYLIAPIEIFLNASGAVFDAFKIIINGIIAAVGQLGGAIGFLIEKVSGSNSLTQALSTFRDSSNEVLAESVAAYKGFQDVTNTPIADTVSPRLAEIEQRLISVKDKSVEAKAAIADVVPQDLGDKFDGVADAFSAMSAGMKAEAVNLSKNISDNFKKIGAQAFTSIAGAVGNAFASFGKSLASGEDALSAFGKSLLNSFGGILVQMGTGFILQGLGFSANPLAPGSGAGLIATGAALAAFGGVLQSLGGGGGGTSGGGVASSPSGGGVAQEPGIVDVPTEEAAVRAPSTSLNVNINGDILGDESSGERIVSLINTAFDQKGIVIRTGALGNA